jgi:hypothetical protein
MKASTRGVPNETPASLLTTNHHETKGHSMARTTKFTEKMRQRRETRAFQRILDSASPNMRTELIAMAQRQNHMR